MKKPIYLLFFCVLAASTVFWPGRGAIDASSGIPSPAEATNAVRLKADATQPGPFVPSIYKTFASWKAACDQLAPNRALKRGMPAKETLPLKRFGQFAEVLDAFLNLGSTGTLARTDAWVGTVPERAEFFNTAKAYFKNQIPFQPYVQKLVVSPRATVLFHGDLHGDIRSLVTWIDWLNKQGYLRDFRVIRPETYLIFLGDYTDRGSYGVEVLYTLFRLKLANPERVFLLRGNHEDVSLVVNYGFLEETRSKYGREFNLERLLRAFDFLPVAIYLGCQDDFIQCSHGGMEPGYNPQPLLGAEGELRFQLLGDLNQAQFRQTHPAFQQQLDPASKRAAATYFEDFRPSSPIGPSLLGFMWNDFSLLKGETQLAYDASRGFVYGDRATGYLLEQAGTGAKRVRAVFRAHQHSGIPNPMMRRLKASQGVFRHWQDGDSLALRDANEAVLTKVLERAGERAIPSNSVWTFNVAPDSMYGEGCDFDFDTFGILTVAESFSQWKLAVMNLTSPKK